MSKLRRINVVIPEDLYQDLKEIAKKKGTMTSVFKHALCLEKWFNEVIEDDGVVCSKKGNHITIIDFPWS
jgi:hypothetical protein